MLSYYQYSFQTLVVFARTDARYKGIVFEDLFALFGVPSINLVFFCFFFFFQRQIQCMAVRHLPVRTAPPCEFEPNIVMFSNLALVCLNE